MDHPGESPLESLLLDSAARGRRVRYGWRRGLLLLVAGLLLLGGYWSRTPPVPALADIPEISGPTKPAPGAATTLMLRATVSALLGKPGGYLANDMLPPGVWLDNMPAFERGAMRAARDMVRALRRDFSRMAVDAVEDGDLQRAEARLLFDGETWRGAEDEYRQALVSLDAYFRRLDNPVSPDTRFHARPEALSRWLEDVDARLENYAQRLSVAAGAGDASADWTAVDNIFFEARGYAWALRAQQEAIAADFSGVLLAADGRTLLDASMRHLDGTQQPLRSPMIMNGSEFGVLANHSLVMAGYLAAAQKDLRQLRSRLSMLQ